MKFIEDRISTSTIAFVEVLQVILSRRTIYGTYVFQNQADRIAKFFPFGGD